MSLPLQFHTAVLVLCGTFLIVPSHPSASSMPSRTAAGAVASSGRGVGSRPSTSVLKLVASDTPSAALTDSSFSWECRCRQKSGCIVRANHGEMVLFKGTIRNEKKFQRVLSGGSIKAKVRESAKDGWVCTGEE